MQSLFFSSTSEKRLRFSVDMQVYVDDPWGVVCGNKSTRDRAMTIMILTWRIIGVRLAFSKARRGPAVDWIGATVAISDPLTVRATIMENKVCEV